MEFSTEAVEPETEERLPTPAEGDAAHAVLTEEQAAEVSEVVSHLLGLRP